MKTRTEVEMPLPYGDTSAEVAEAFLSGLGYKPVACVRKARKEFHLPRGAFAVEMSPRLRTTGPAWPASRTTAGRWGSWSCARGPATRSTRPTRS